MATTDPALLTAITEHDAGRLDQAEAIYRARLAEAPKDLAALIGLGDVLTDSSRASEAETFYRQAIEVDSESPEAAGAYDGLAAVLQDTGDLDGAIIASKKAAVLRGSADDALGVGNTLEYLGRINDAVEMFQLAASLRHDFTEAHTKAAQHLMNAGNAAAAVTHYQAAVQSRPEVAELHSNLAAARQQTGENNQALNSARAAIELKPQLPEAHNVMGMIWKERGRWADALGALGRAVMLKPDFAEALNNTGAVLQNIGRADEAGSFFERAVSVRPDVTEFHLNLARNLLLRGDYARGFDEFEWRRTDPKNSSSRPFPQLMWDGLALQNQTLLIHAEPTIGHTILFLRYLKLVRHRAGADAKIVLEIQPALAEIARLIPSVNEVVIQGEHLPAFDAHCPLLSLSKLFETTPQNIPAHVPYLKADVAKAAQWSEKLSSSKGNRRIGIAWTDSSRSTAKRDRNCPVNKLAPLAMLPGITLFNLENFSLPADLKAVDLLTGESNLSDAAALIQHMDVIIAADTSLAHLAAAMGKKICLLLSESPDWCWMIDRPDSPWYPTATLFRQSNSRTWGDVVNAVTSSIKSL